MLLVLFFSLTFQDLCLAEVTNKQYASMPEIFHLDNYDRCMLLEDDALYCAFQYELKPLNEKNATKLWNIIKEVSSDIYNFRHDHLRHSICVPLTCPNIKLPTQNETTLHQEIADCYDEKFEHMGLRGDITKLRCDTNRPRYPVDWIDITVAIIFLFYISIVTFATFYEGLARYQPEEDYNRITNTKHGKLLAAFSLAKNWHRLKSVKHNPETEKLRLFQGVRFYNILIVIIAHTALFILCLPQINTKFAENVADIVPTIFLASGSLALSTNFFMSSFFLFIGVFSKFEGKKKAKPKVLLSVLIARYLRLTPCLLVVLTLHSTWLRHFQSGPRWYLVEEEYLRCRKNFWTNLFYINTIVDSRNMCMPTTWYLALDMQYYVFLLVIVYYMQKHPNLIWHIIGCLLCVNVIGTFIQNYKANFPAFLLPVPESLYEMNNILPNPQWHGQYISPIGNMAGSIIGLAFGYLYYKYSNQKLFASNFRLYLHLSGIFAFVTSVGIIVIPGMYVLMFKMELDPFWASVYVAVSRPIFIVGIGVGILVGTKGWWGIAASILEWRPAYVLGKLSYTAYLIHIALMSSSMGITRSPVYVTSIGTVVYYLLGNVFMTFIAALLLTLFVEMPMAELQKLAISSHTPDEEKKEKEK